MIGRRTDDVRGQRRHDALTAVGPEELTIPAFDIYTTIRGAVEPRARAYAEQKIARLAHLARGSVLTARLQLRQEPDAALERPSIAKASLDVSGKRLRTHVAAPTMTQAADQVEARLQRGLKVLAERREARSHDTGVPKPGRWRESDLPTARPSFFPRPVDDREIVRRVTFGLGAITPEEAAVELELLDHDFLLFTDSANGAESVIYRRPDDTYGVIPAGTGTGRTTPYVDWITVDPTPAPTLTIAEALERLDVGQDPFVFFLDASRGRGSIVYRRYDGHYGLIEPRNESDSNTTGVRDATTP